MNQKELTKTYVKLFQIEKNPLAPKVLLKKFSALRVNVLCTLSNYRKKDQVEWHLESQVHAQEQ